MPIPDDRSVDIGHQCRGNVVSVTVTTLLTTNELHRQMAGFTHIHITFKLTLKSVWISFVSKMYPSGIQLRNRSKVSSVASTSAAFCEFS